MTAHRADSARALVLSGGGVTGFLYEIGVLTALEEAVPRGKLARHFELVVGTSAGAVAGALVANGVRATNVYEAIHDNRISPLNFGRADVLGLARPTPVLIA